MAEMTFNTDIEYNYEYNFVYRLNEGEPTHFVIEGIIDPNKKLFVPNELGTFQPYEIRDTATYAYGTNTHKREIQIVEIEDGCNAMIGQLSFANNSNLKVIYIPKSISIINDNAFENCKQAIVYYRGDYDSLATKFVGAPYPLPIESQVSRINYNKNPFTGEGEGDQDFEYSFQEGPYFYKIISDWGVALVKYLRKYDEKLEYASIPQGYCNNEIMGTSYEIAEIKDGAFSDLYFEHFTIAYPNQNYDFPEIKAGAFENSTIKQLQITQHSEITTQIGQYIPAQNITIDCGYDTVTIDANAFKGNRVLQTIVFNDIYQLTIKNSAFANSSLETVALSSFGENFEDSINPPEGFGEDSNPFINVGEQAFENSELKNISFPEISEQIYELIYDEFEGEIGLLFLNAGCFQNTQIEHLDLSNTFLLSVPSSFFKEENIIKSVVFPKTLTRIDGCAFDRCKSLTKIIMEKNKYKTISICDNFISYDDNPPSKKPLFIFKGKPTDLEIVDDNNEYVGEFRPWIAVIFANLSVKIKHNNTLKDIYKIYTKTINALKEIDYFTYKPNKEENK